jgi:Mn2+/Fe2+ NRAMP family transporter
MSAGRSGKSRLGPGLVYFFTALGPGTFLTSAVAGATYGYDLLWALAAALLFRYVWVTTAAAYVLVTGESLIQGYARIGRWLVWTALAVTVVVRHSSNLYTIHLMGDAAHILMPLPTAASAAVWSAGLTLLGVLMMVWGGYPLIERGCTLVIAALGMSLPIAALLAGPDPQAVLRGLLIPVVPDTAGLYSALLLLAAMVGTQAGSISNLSYPYFATEKGWAGADDLRRQRLDLLASTAARFGMGLLLQVTAAATLLPLGIKPDSATSLVGLYGVNLGPAGTAIFGAGLWGICFSSFVGGTMGYSLIVRDICRRFVPGLRLPADASATPAPGSQDPVYRWSVALLGLSPLYILWLQVEPVALTLAVRSMVVVVIPLLVGSLLILANDRARMRGHGPGVFGNAVLTLLILVSIYLTIRDSAEWWRLLTRIS